MLGVKGEDKKADFGQLAAMLSGLSEQVDAIGRKAQHIENGGMTSAVEQMTATMRQAVERMADVTNALAASVANPKAPTVNVPAADNRALLAAITKLERKPCAYHFSVTARDGQGKISEMVARPMSEDKY
jgi:hypothetical protein